MSLQFGTTLRNDWCDQLETRVGTSAKLQVFTGAQPANCAAADSGTKLLEISLPSDWMNAASGGSKTKLGTWSDVGLAAGSMGHFRLKDSTATTCHMQGSVTASGGGGDMTADNVSVAVGQTATVNSFTFTAPGA